MNKQVRHWHELKAGMEMPEAIVLLGQPDDSFATESNLIVWTFNTGGWIRFKSDRVMDWGNPLGWESKEATYLGSAF